MKNVWLNKKNGWVILVCLLISVGLGKFIKSRPQIPQNTAQNPPSWRVQPMKVTAYCPCEKCCGKFADGKTSIGKDAWKTLGVAADPKLLPYGTKIEIPGVGVRMVDDTGGAMRQDAKKGIYHIDVRFHNHQEAKEFGVRWLDVKILG